MTDAASLLVDLLTCIEQVEKIRNKPAYSVPTEFFVASQDELEALAGVEFDLRVRGDEVWLRLPRLQEIAAPPPVDVLKPWVLLSPSPHTSPLLRSEAAVPGGVESEQEGTSSAAGRSGTERAPERIEDHPELGESFDRYIESEWAPWAAAERPRRKTIERYQQLFALRQAVASDGVDSPVELVWGVGRAVWKRRGSHPPVDHPLLVQACEIRLDEESLAIEIRPREAQGRLEIGCYAEMGLPGVRALEAMWQHTLTKPGQRLDPFDAATFSGILAAAVALLDPAEPDPLGADEVAGERLKIAKTWVLFGRRRSSAVFVDDVQRLKASVEAATDLPRVFRSFVEPGEATLRVQSEQPFRGLSSSDSPAGASELYFPMPYNDEQLSIIRKLEGNDGIVVQGPPGTGKTHTIANVVAHYLATGRKVLVTAKSESALAVLQQKLPERIRPLSMALLADEREGLQQFARSVEIIVATLAGIEPSRAEAAITTAGVKLDKLHARIANVDRKLAECAASQMRPHRYQGEDILPDELARRVLEQTETHRWFDDEPAVPDEGGNGNGDVPIDDADIATLRRARIEVGADLAHLKSSVPAADALPSWADLLALHRDFAKARAIEPQLAEPGLLGFVDAQPETIARAQALIEFLDERAACKARLAVGHRRWMDVLVQRLASMPAGSDLPRALFEACRAVQKLEASRRQLLSDAVELPDDAEMDPDFCRAIERLAEGKRAFGFGRRPVNASKLIASVTVLGVTPPASAGADWALVRRSVAWRNDARKILARWNSLAGEFGLEPATDVDMGFKKLAQALGPIEEARRLVFDFDAELHERVAEVFGKQVADRTLAESDSYLAVVRRSLPLQIENHGVADAAERGRNLLHTLDVHSAAIEEAHRRAVHGALGNAFADEAALRTAWQGVQARVARLAALRPAFDEIVRVSAALEAAGAPRWAQRVRTQPAAPDHDPFTPPSWRDAWNWRRALMLLDRIDSHDRLRRLSDERRALTLGLARTYEDLIAEKTWLAVFRRSPESVRQALQKYLTAVRAIGKEAGTKLGLYRQDARDAMARAYTAIPCWILPEWRIAETLPAEVGLFDLVVIDEASQSDIWALPALLRGKKLLVVGDHRQVSPSVGLESRAALETRSRLLANQPHGRYMTPERSIYDLAQVVFAGNAVMLKEHFRCVPAIIEFSNREFYESRIRPLRLPKANERLDPPLVDIHVDGGRNDGGVNAAEASAIVDEIEAVLADARFDGRSIGVVTLVGTAQAAFIQGLIGKRISPADSVARKLSVGPPPVFQGQERDIMMVSMVLGPGDPAAPDRADMNQRFNVALSRARDRTYLFRSVDEAAFAPGTLNARLMRYFRQPFRPRPRDLPALRERCHTRFEFEMFDLLVGRGYRVEPQVPCGDFQIDLVVEGSEGRRLAIECDGDDDGVHDAGQWADRMARQRVLERAGWTFWRCFAASFVRHRDAVVADLLQTLGQLGIEPLGANSVDVTRWVRSSQVDAQGASGERKAG